MKNRTFDEMISHFNITVSEMQITQKQKMELLGMITAIAMKHNESVKHGHWISKIDSPISDVNWHHECSVCGMEYRGYDYYYCPRCGALMDEVTE